MHRTLSLLILALFLITCSKESPEAQNNAPVIAKVGDQVISETSFQRAYLPVLLYGDKFDSPENREEMIQYLVGQKILSGEARESKLDTMTMVKRSAERQLRKSMTRQLYHEWVRKQLDPPEEAEIREGFQRGKKSIYVRHLFAKTREEIQSYSDRLKEGKDSFYSLAAEVFDDSVLASSGGALGWMTFGDLDETLEDTLYQMKPGQISEPVQSQYGWHLLAMDDSQEEVFVTEEDFQKNKDLIRKKIIERRENVLGKRILNEFMSDVNIEFNRDVARQVWPIVRNHLNPDQTQFGVSPEFSALQDQLMALRNETILTVNGEDWTVAQILARMPELERSLLYGNLYVAASNIIRDEMLAREALRLGLDTHPIVLEEVRDQEDRVLADTYVLNIADTFQFTGEHERAHYEHHKLDMYHGPDSLLLSLFYFNDSLAAARAIYQLRTGIIATDPQDDLMWIHGADQLPTVYQQAKTVSVGTMIGPFKHNNKWTLFRLEDRRRYPLAFDQIKKRIRTDMEADRFGTIRTILLDSLRSEHKIDIDLIALHK